MIGRIAEDNQGNRYVEKLAGLNADTIPLGAVQDVYTGATIPEGWLECDGSRFDTTVYPELALLLGGNTLPLLLRRNDDVLLNKEIMTGKFYKGHPVYRYAFTYSTAMSSGTWYQVPNSNTLVASLDMILLVSSSLTDHLDSNTAYTHGNAPAMVQINTNGYLYVLNPGVGTAAASTGGTNTYVIEYIKNTDDYTNAKYAIIKAVAGIPASQASVCNTLFNNVKDYVDANTPVYTYDSSTETLTITQRGV